MVKKVLLGCLVATTLVLSGCAGKSGNQKLGEMSKEQMDSQVIKGKSTKNDVKAILGDPSKTDITANGNEKWTYIHARAEAKAINYVPVASLFVRGTNNTVKTLVVVFDDSGVVKNYTSSVSQGETKGGLFQ